ncbi:MAG TPA: MazG nucleotide pyrophosphohydrolase domain-containing protein [Candidatus Saccharimonadales bacterium]|nr:MazG nucleotide pyrophosphohydrolase domain-containing protein [Candidatus Saccharimonadales bacterium]
MSTLHLKSHPTLQDIQDYVVAMEAERGFSDQTVMQPALLLAEEVGELMKCIRKSHAGLAIDVNKQYELDAAGEIADILIVLTSIANRLGVDIEQAFRDKEENNKQRTWQ